MNLEADPSIKSHNEIIAMKTGSNPEKVIDEGDSLNIGSIIHSFYWKWDVYKKHDYEPVAFSKDDKCCLTRLHNHGIVIWQNFTEEHGKPVAYFFSGFHTPIICTKQVIQYLDPDGIFDRLVLHGYFIPTLNELP